ncbi:MAG: sigma-70 family RNA polymerase sigma factor [Anaerolineales bacterium]|nr:sigma-70 family RNA polymerase sigma factor [Anaerolineales bacterium]
MDHAKQDDENLLHLIARAHPDALSELYDRYGRLVFSVAYHATSDVSLAEEITQDTFLRVWQRAESYHPQAGKVAAWLASIARHRAIDLYRRSQARREGSVHALEDMPDFELLDDVPGLETSLEIEQSRQQVRSALSQLPLEQRRVLALAYFRGLTHEQIAQVLALPLGTVKTRLRLGMQKMRQFF